MVVLKKQSVVVNNFKYPLKASGISDIVGKFSLLLKREMWEWRASIIERNERVKNIRGGFLKGTTKLQGPDEFRALNNRWLR